MTTKTGLLRIISRQCHLCVDNNTEIENDTFYLCALEDLRPRYKSLWDEEKHQEMIRKVDAGVNTPPTYALSLPDGKLHDRKAFSKKSILHQIRQHCIFCMGGQQHYIKDCSSTGCALYPYRTGKDPHPHPTKVAQGRALAEKYGFKKKD